MDKRERQFKRLIDADIICDGDEDDSKLSFLWAWFFKILVLPETSPKSITATLT